MSRTRRESGSARTSYAREIRLWERLSAFEKPELYSFIVTKLANWNPTTHRQKANFSLLQIPTFILEQNKSIKNKLDIYSRDIFFC